MKRSRSIGSAACLLCAVALAVACGQPARDEAGIEFLHNGEYQALALTSYEISGARDGATTTAVALFTLDDGERIRVNLEVSYNPTPVLASGSWQREGSESEGGDVRDESLTFLGGQGSSPSVGGRFRLESDGVTKYRVTMPVQTLERTKRY